MLVSSFFVVFDVNYFKTTHYIGPCAFGIVFLYLYLNQIRKKVYIIDCTECSTGLLGLIDTCRDQPIQKYESLLRCTQWDSRFSAVLKIFTQVHCTVNIIALISPYRHYRYLNSVPKQI